MEESGHSPRWRRALKPASRWLCLAAALWLAWPLRQESATAILLPALSPWIAAASAISARTLSLLALLAAPVLVLVMIFPRWFCRFGCPAGLLQELVERARPGAPKLRKKGPLIGPWLVLLALGGALLGYPLFLWLDPLAIFNGFLNAWRPPLAWDSLLTGLGLPLLLGLAAVAPRFWCQRLCPLGATQDWLARPRRLFQAKSPLPETGRAAGGAPNFPGRRWFLGICAGAAGALAVKTVRGQIPPLRPPGSCPEPQFTGLCVRCGNCAQACPSRIIQPDFGASGVMGFLTPRLRFDRDYCRKDCHRCNQVCPSGAIARLSLADKRRRVIGVAVVDLDLCLLAQGRECTACIRHCPYQSIVMESADGGFSNQPGVLSHLCNGCGACQAICPAQPARAIQIHAHPASPDQGLLIRK